MRHSATSPTSVSYAAVLLLAAVAAASCRGPSTTVGAANEVDAQLVADIKAHEDHFWTAASRATRASG